MEYEIMINDLMPKLRAISRKVRNRYAYCDEDDFLQEALLYLWMINKEGAFADKTDSYILQGCYFFLKNYVRKLCKGVDVNSTSIFEECFDDDRPFEEVLPSASYIESQGSVEIVLLMDEMEDKFTEREKDIFFYRMEGYTSREIGEKIGVSHVMVGKIGNRIREKCMMFKEELI